MPLLPRSSSDNTAPPPPLSSSDNAVLPPPLSSSLLLSLLDGAISLLGIKNLYDAKPVAIHVFGKPAEGELKRPFASAPSLFGGGETCCSSFLLHVFVSHGSTHFCCKTDGLVNCEGGKMDVILRAVLYVATIVLRDILPRS